MIFSAAVLSVLLPAALARPRPDVSSLAVDFRSFRTTPDSSPVETLQAALRKIRADKAGKTTSAAVAATRSELIAGRCNDIIVIFARGTTEPGNVGDDVGPSFFDALAALEPGRVIVQGVNYPADILGYLQGGSDSGASDMADLVGRAASQCPDSKIVLSGFSQGAQVTHKAAKKIPTSLQPKVAAIVLFGDPNNGAAFPGTLNANVKTFCHEGDLICHGLPIPTEAHLHYEDDAPEAAAFVAARV
ncbi:Carbohydrate Esterase Family 5 protein [Tuber magnatum]|uniref:cutinase n=1 Tax=Tuber magnatum TaxID=42249 RepID=A0A317ST07_9PEZI|nr:Carbohydrate Esterase Family 5 protein [Tuber magnatum]